MSLLINHGSFSTPFESEATTLLKRGQNLGYTLPSRVSQLKLNKLYRNLKAVGLFSKCLVGYVFATDGDSNFATLNLKLPTSFQCTKVNSPTFSSGTGFNSNGSNSYLNTNFALSNLTQNSVTYCAKGYINSSLVSRTLFGASNDDSFGGVSGGIFLNPKNVSNNIFARLSTISSVQAANSDARNRISVAKSGNTGYLSVNGAAYSGYSETFASITTSKNIYLLVSNGATAPQGYNVGGIQYFFIFNGKLSNTEIANFDTAVAQYLS